MQNSRSLLFHRNGWAVAASTIVALAILALCCSVFLQRSYGGPLPSVLLALVLIALGGAIALHARFLLLARRAHRETSRVLDSTEKEFESIFDSALDAILILDDQGICREANPAALALFRTERHRFVGSFFSRFYDSEKKATDPNHPLLGRKSGSGEMEFIQRDGQVVFVEYTIRADYLPGRHVAVLRDVSARRAAETALRESEERFRKMADNIEEVFWMLDAGSKQLLFVNAAFKSITGRSLDSLQQNPLSYQELFHPEDRVRILTRLEEASETGLIDEEFRIVRPDHAVRWVLVRGFAVRNPDGNICRLVGTAQDITARKSAEEQMATSLAYAESSSAEANAFRKITLALTENLRMDSVLDTLLESLLELVPCDSARVLLVESETHLFLARERQHSDSRQKSSKFPPTLDAAHNRFLMEALTTRSTVLLADTREESDWLQFKGSPMRSFLCVPLVASGRVLGLLALGDAAPRAFQVDHQRLAKSLALPAAVAIQNARLYERAEIYGAELEKRLADLEQTENALRQAQRFRSV